MKKESSKKIGKKTISIILSAAMVLGMTGCKKEETAEAPRITNENQEQVLEEVLKAQVSPSHSSHAGKEETVYVLADAKGSVDQVIVSDWLKNGKGAGSLADCSDLMDIQNIKGYETFEKDEEGNLVWKAEGADIYYRGTTDKEVPVEVKISYQLDGRDILPEELAGKSGRVKIRMDYENKETRKVSIGGKEQEIKVPFAMISGMVLPQETFSNIETTNARLLSEGNNSVVVGVAFPGLKESIDMDGLKDKLEDGEKKEKIEEMEIPDYIEVEADAQNFQLGMTMTVAMSDILSDIELTDSFDLAQLNDSMEELQEASDQLKDGTKELKDGSGKLKEGTEELLEGTTELRDGAGELKSGTQELYEKSGDLNEGAGRLRDGAGELREGAGALGDGAGKLKSGASELYDGTAALQEGAQRLSSGANALQDGGAKLAVGTGSMVDGARNLNEGAHMVKNGVDQVASQMGMLQAKVGTPVEDGSSVDPSNPQTLLQLSYLLNQSLREASMAADGLTAQSYGEILSQLQQRKSQVQENLNTSDANLSAAQGRVSEAEAQMSTACVSDYEELIVVEGSHLEEQYVDVPIPASEDEGEEPDLASVVVTTEVLDTNTRQVQSVDLEELQQRVNEYKAAVEEAAVYQAESNAYARELAAIDEEISMIDAQAANQEALKAKWGPAITCAAGMDQYLRELSAALSDQEGIAALVQGADSLANGTQNALLGATELNNGANELKNGIDSLNSGADELVGGAGSLVNGAAALKGGASELADGASALEEGTQELKNGTEELKNGTEQLVTGTGALNDGAGTLQDGVDTLKEGVLTLDEGMGTLDEGALALVDGMFEFDEEGIRKLTELFGEDVQDVIDRLTAVADAGKEYNTFTKLPEETEGSVKFVIKTEGVKEP